MEFNLSPSLGKTPVGNELLKSMVYGFVETFFLLINSLHCSQQSKEWVWPIVGVGDVYDVMMLNVVM
ncbi:hypothetical protein ACSBR2_038083 [Camellia fascicularis]